MTIFRRGALILILAVIVRAGTPPGDEPCEEAGTIVEGINDLRDLPFDSTDGDETQFLEWLCIGAPCDLMPCFPSFEFQWAEFTATCTEAMSITTYTSKGEVGPASLVSLTCDCMFDNRRPFGWIIGGGCPFDDVPISFLVVPGRCYKFAIFGGESAVIEPLEDLTYVCDFYWFGYYTGWFYEDVAAFVSCQVDCDSPTCGKCFDADEDGVVTLRDFAEFQNNAPW